VPFAPVPRIAAGAEVAVVAPSSPFDREVFERGLAVLATRYRPVVGPNVFARHRHLAGTDEQRLADLEQAFATHGAIFTVRGGYGAARLLPRFVPGPRALVGFSDTTALHGAMQQRGFRSLHAPVLTQLGRLPAEAAARLFDALEGRPLAPLSGTRTVTAGAVEGPLLGGNLSVLSRLIGTPWLPSLRGAVLLLEDVGERPYRLDRMWTHLAQAGVFEGVAGVVFGELTGCDDAGATWTAADVLDELAATLGVPCLAGLPIGHGEVNQAVVLGARVRLDASAKRLEFPEGLTS
jgi:muramoyltetrapeptide carboxypeptidase